jgi:hypothetical protein
LIALSALENVKIVDFVFLMRYLDLETMDFIIKYFSIQNTQFPQIRSKTIPLIEKDKEQELE